MTSVNETTRATANAKIIYSDARSVSVGQFATNVSSRKHARREVAKEASIEDAVFSHIQALRALGITRTNTRKIAAALGISQRAVENTIAALKSKGVKVVNG